MLSLLCQDTEYRVREIIQEASKFMRHSNRTKLTTDDINYALRLKHVEPIFGYDPSDPIAFKHFAQGDLYYIADREVDFDTLLTCPLPKIPPSINMNAHWLAIEGIQPQIPENPIISQETFSTGMAPDFPQETGGASSTEISDAILGSADPAGKGQPIRHHLSKEHQTYFDIITKCLLVKDATTNQTALKSLKSDAGIQQLVPYFIQFTAEMVMKHLRQLDTLSLLMETLDVLLNNSYLFLEPYLHQVMPTLLTCVVGKRLCQNPEKEDHWKLRENASQLVSLICRRFGDAYVALQPRILKTLSKALNQCDSTGANQSEQEWLLSLPQKYGALICLTILGKESVQLIILPKLEEIYKSIHRPNSSHMFIHRCHQALLFSMKGILAPQYEDLLKNNHPSPISVMEGTHARIFQCFGKDAIIRMLQHEQSSINVEQPRAAMVTEEEEEDFQVVDTNSAFDSNDVSMEDA